MLVFRGVTGSKDDVINDEFRCFSDSFGFEFLNLVMCCKSSWFTFPPFPPTPGPHHVSIPTLPPMDTHRHLGKVISPTGVVGVSSWWISKGREACFWRTSMKKATWIQRFLLSNGWFGAWSLSIPGILCGKLRVGDAPESLNPFLIPASLEKKYQPPAQESCTNQVFQSHHGFQA